MIENTHHHSSKHETSNIEEAQHGSHTSAQHEVAQHEGHEAHDTHKKHEDHAQHQDHTGHEEMFRKRFWVVLVLSIPVLIFSPAIQGWLGYSTPEFPGSQLIVPGLSILIFIYGGLPFLRMAVPEIQARSPGMMTLISLAISVFNSAINGSCLFR